jgi:hypothetical protein
MLMKYTICILIFLLHTIISNSQVNIASINLNDQVGIEHAQIRKSKKIYLNQGSLWRRDSLLEANWQKSNKNYITISPLAQMIENGGYYIKYKNAGPGFQVAYERSFSRNVSLYLPTFFSIYSDYKSIGLALKLYPNSLNPMKFAFMPTFIVGSNKIQDYYYDENGFTKPQDGRRYSYVIQFNSSINLTLHKRYFLSVILGPGFGIESYKFKHKSLTSIYGVDVNGYNSLNFYTGFHMGYAF